MSKSKSLHLLHCVFKTKMFVSLHYNFSTIYCTEQWIFNNQYFIKLCEKPSIVRKLSNSKLKITQKVIHQYYRKSKLIQKICFNERKKKSSFLVLAHLFVGLPWSGDREVAFLVFEPNCHLVLSAGIPLSVFAKNTTSGFAGLFSVKQWLEFTKLFKTSAKIGMSEFKINVQGSILTQALLFCQERHPELKVQ